MPEVPEILTASRFFLELKLDGSQDPVDGYFMDCKGFKTTQEVVEACEVTPMKWGSANAKKGLVVRTKVPGNSKFTNITLKRGLTVSKTLWQWFADVEAGNWHKQRKLGTLVIYDQSGAARARYHFTNAWPTSYTIADLSAYSNDIEIEELEIACEKLERVN
jgi:phage tail-like protein